MRCGGKQIKTEGKRKINLRAKVRKDSAKICFGFYVFAAALTLFIFLATFFLAEKKPEPARFSEHWYMDMEMTQEADLKHPDSDHFQNSFYAVLPERLQMGDCLWFKYRNGYYTVSVDGRIRSENISEGYSVIYGKTSGTNWACIPLDGEDASKTIQISFMPSYDDRSAYIDEIYIGQTIGAMRLAISDRLFEMTLCILMMVSGAVLILLYIVFAALVRGLPRELLYLGTFAFFTSLWSLSELNVLQIFTSKNAGIFNNLTCMTLMLIAFPLVLYFKADLDRKNRCLTPLYAFLMVLNFTVCCVLHFSGLYDFHATLGLTHATIGMGSLLIVYANYLRCCKNPGRARSDIPLAVCMLLFIAAWLTDIIRYYFGGFDDSSFFTRIALLVYVIALCIKSLVYLVDMVRKGMKADIIAHLAYEDGLTGLGNRTAYDERLEALKKKALTIFVFDINNLKYVNDTFGHLCGDELIKAGADVIASVFGGIGTCYRTGGDEFVCLADSMIDADSYAEQFRKSILEFNQANALTFPLVIALGYETFDGGSDILAALEAADQKMYQNKKELKKEENYQIRKGMVLP